MQTLTFNKNEHHYNNGYSNYAATKFSYNSQDNLSFESSEANMNTSSNNLSLKTPFEKLVFDLKHNSLYIKEITLGKLIGFYRIGSEIGSGNFSQVKLGVHLLTREKVAIKILDKTKLDDKTQRLLLREISSMEKLHHPNIIRLYEVIHKPTKLYICMEYAPEGELYTRINEFGKMNETECKFIYSQIISAVDHMHSHNIIHRDIKAENIFYYNTSPPMVKLGDFGFSIEAHIEKQLNTYCGSPPYAAPELFRDDSYIGIYVDIWALGVLLYFMMSGLMPFKAETVGKLKRIILSGDYIIPSHVSDSCQLLIRGILRPVPADRFSIQEIMDSAWLDGEKFIPQLEPYQLNPSVDSSECKREELRSKDLLETLGITQEILVYCNLKEHQIQQFTNGYVNNSIVNKNLNLSPIPIVTPVGSNFFTGFTLTKNLTQELKQSVNGTYRIIFHRVQKEFRKEFHRVSHSSSYNNNNNNNLASDLNAHFSNTANQNIAQQNNKNLPFNNRNNDSCYDNSDPDEEYDNETLENSIQTNPNRNENKSIFVKLNTENSSLNRTNNNRNSILVKQQSTNIFSNNNNNKQNENHEINNNNNTKLVRNHSNTSSMNKQNQTLYQINRKISNGNFPTQNSNGYQVNNIYHERNGTIRRSSRGGGVSAAASGFNGDNSMRHNFNQTYPTPNHKALQKQSSKLCTIL